MATGAAHQVRGGSGSDSDSTTHLPTPAPAHACAHGYNTAAYEAHIPVSVWDNSSSRCEYRRFRIDASISFVRGNEKYTVQAAPQVQGIERLSQKEHVDGTLPLAERPVSTFGVKSKCDGKGKGKSAGVGVAKAR